MTALLISHIARGTPQWITAVAILALYLHVMGGVVGVGSGYVAIVARKGGRLHARAGTVFFAALLTMAGMGLSLAIFLRQPGNIAGGSIVLYLTMTAWLATRQRNGKPGPADVLACVAVAALAAALFFMGTHPDAAARASGMTPMYFVFAAFATFAAALDLKVLLRGGVTGTQRITRHLWRMSSAFFFASASLFLGQQQILPTVLQRAPIPQALAFAPLAFMLFWLVKVGVTQRRQAVAA